MSTNGKGFAKWQYLSTKNGGKDQNDQNYVNVVYGCIPGSCGKINHVRNELFLR